jgi:hypothetical protein
MKRLLMVMGLLGAILSIPRCLVESTCYNDADCPGGHFCDMVEGKCQSKCFDHSYCPAGSHCDVITGMCVENECESNADCDPAFECLEWQCVSLEPIICPDEMVGIENRFCIDIYEASRPDATATDPGSDDSMPTSRPGVLPWIVGSRLAARQACQAAGKDLCDQQQWELVCRGPDNTVYSYGDDYDPETCNGIDKYCYCDAGSDCEDQDPCPFPHCYGVCGADFHVGPTGSHAGCTNAYGVFDINGNLWEFVQHGAEILPRGGAYNCLNSEQLHRCDYVPSPTFLPPARGFRCCRPGLDE